MKGIYVSFPEPKRVCIEEETVGSPGPGEILCQAQKSLISIGTEMYCLRGVFEPGTNWAAWVRYPFRPGYSMAARVIAVGQGVNELEEGDRVLLSAPHQQFSRIPAQQALRIPAYISDEEATWGPLACTTQLAVRRAGLQLGETAGVVGAGILGQLIVQYLLLCGVRKVIAVDLIAGRLAVARAHGATETVCMDVQGAREAIRGLTAGRMLDAVWDVTGNPAVLPCCIPLLHQLGRVILVGDTPTPSEQHLAPGVVSSSLAILGIHGNASAPHYSAFTPWTQSEIISLFFDYLHQGRMRVADLITHRFSPLAAPEVYASLAQDRSVYLGTVFDWTLLQQPSPQHE